MPILLVTEILLKNCNVFLESFNLISEDLFIITRWIACSYKFIVQLLSLCFKFSVLFGQVRNFLVSLISEFFIISLLSLSVLLTFSQLSSGSIKFVCNFLDNSSLFFSLKIVLSLSSVKFILSWLNFTFETVNGVVKLVNSVMISFTISLKSACKVVNSSVVFLIFLRCSIWLNFKFVLKGIDLCSEGKFSFFFLSFLFFLISDQILNFLVLVSQKPVLSVNLSHKCFDFVIVTWKNTGSFLLLKISVLHFNIDDFWSIVFLKLENLFPESCIFKFKSFHLTLVSVSKIFVFSKLVLEFIMFVVVRSLELANLILK